MNLRPIATVAIMLLLSGCSDKRQPWVPIQSVPASEQRPMMLRAEAGALRSTAYRQGPIEMPRPIHVPCRNAPPEAQYAVVETIIDAEGRVALATVIAGARGPHVDEAVRSCLESARFTPPRMDGRKIPVYFNLTIGVNNG